MANAVVKVPKRPVDFKKTASAIGIKFSRSIRSRFEEHSQNVAKMEAEREKVSHPATEAIITAARQKANSDPSPDSVAALNNLDPDALRARNEKACNEWDAAKQRVCEKNKSLYLEIRDAALEAIDAEIKRQEKAATDRAARFGLSADLDEDEVLIALKHYRGALVNSLSCERSPASPRHVLALLGEVA